MNIDHPWSRIELTTAKHLNKSDAVVNFPFVYPNTITVAEEEI